MKGLPPGPAIGPVRLANPFVLAPMAGVTDLPFRILCREAGAGLVSAEMLSDLALVAGSRRSRTILTISPWEHPISVQLCGSQPDAMAKAAVQVADAGADIVNINMGCPAPKIVANREGAALMRQPSLAREIIQAVREAVPSSVPVTAKIRAGWEEGWPEAEQFAQVLERAGAAAITVHGRYRNQFYRGLADWGIIRAVKLAVGVPVIGNGDVRNGADAMRMLAGTGCDAVMIGRALGNPWVFASCVAAWRLAASGERSGGARGGGLLDDEAAVSAATAADVAVRHLKMALALKGGRRGLVEMRKHAAWYIRGSPGAAARRDQLMRAADPGEVERLLREAVGQDFRISPGYPPVS